MKAIIWDFSGTLYNTKENKLYDGAKQILKKCSTKYKQAIVTAQLSNAEGRKQLIKNLGLWKYFDIVKVSLKRKKTFLDICKRFNCKPEEVYVIGDGYRLGPYPREIKTGNELGMKTIWCNFKNTSKLKQILLGIKCWKEIKCLKELKDIL